MKDLKKARPRPGVRRYGPIVKRFDYHPKGVALKSAVLAPVPSVLAQGRRGFGGLARGLQAWLGGLEEKPDSQEAWSRKLKASSSMD